jgi:hypothetical protein
MIFQSYQEESSMKKNRKGLFVLLLSLIMVMTLVLAGCGGGGDSEGGEEASGDVTLRLGQVLNCV